MNSQLSQKFGLQGIAQLVEFLVLAQLLQIVEGLDFRHDLAFDDTQRQFVGQQELSRVRNQLGLLQMFYALLKHWLDVEKVGQLQQKIHVIAYKIR